MAFSMLAKIVSTKFTFPSGIFHIFHRTCLFVEHIVSVNTQKEMT